MHNYLDLFVFAGNGTFPHPNTERDFDVLAFGEVLQPDDILLAYRFGIFPWNNPEMNICWWAPDPQWIIPSHQVKVHKSMHSLLNSMRLRVTVDTAFGQVLSYCAAGLTRKESGTWIDDRIIECYTELFRRGIAHSFEVWEEDKLVAGLYGVNIGRTFVGESMFTHVTNGSKYGLIMAANYLYAHEIFVINCQYHNPHLEHMGAIPVAREDYIRYMRYHGFLLKNNMGSWTESAAEHFSKPINFL